MSPSDVGAATPTDTMTPMANSGTVTHLSAPGDFSNGSAVDRSLLLAPRRRKSSGLGAELLVGDTGAPAISTGIANNGQHDSSDDASTPPLENPPLGRPPAADGTHASMGAVPIVGHHRFSKRRKARSLLGRVKHYAIRHTWVLPLAIILAFLAGYAVNPTASNPLHPFLFLSYELPPDDPRIHIAPGQAYRTQYGKGPWDLALVAFYTVFLSFSREFIMQEVMRPMARRCGLRSRGKQARFMEQMYTAVYFGLLGPAGLWVMSRTPLWFFSTRALYEHYPHKTHDAAFKFYYLFEAAYWAQQAIVLLLGLEKRRKDFRELVAHHILTLSLIWLSYKYHFTHMGLLVYITHDVSDFFLATSKTLNYIDHAITGPYYAFFIGIWVYTRHYLNLRLLWSLRTEFRTVGPYGIDWAAQQYKCTVSYLVILGLLGSLQALNVFWLFYIMRIAYRYVVHRSARDEREDGDDDEEEEEEEEEEDVAVVAAAAPHKPVVHGATSAAATPALLLNSYATSVDAPILTNQNGTALNSHAKRAGR